MVSPVLALKRGGIFDAVEVLGVVMLLRSSGNCGADKKVARAESRNCIELNPGEVYSSSRIGYWC